MSNRGKGGGVEKGGRWKIEVERVGGGEVEKIRLRLRGQDNRSA